MPFHWPTALDLELMQECWGETAVKSCSETVKAGLETEVMRGRKGANKGERNKKPNTSNEESVARQDLVDICTPMQIGVLFQNRKKKQ